MKKRRAFSIILVVCMMIGLLPQGSIKAKNAEDIKISYQKGDSADHITKNITLPTTGSDGSTITWESSNPDIIGSDGAIQKIPDTNITVTLTATVKKDKVTTKKTFTITVIGKTPPKEKRDISIVYKDFSNHEELLQTNKDATIVDKKMRLTPAKGNRAGSTFYKNKISFSDKRSFSTAFAFKMDNLINGGADGIVFTIQNKASTAGSIGGGIGYENLKPSLGVEFDTWENGEYEDKNDNHIGIDINGSVKSVKQYHSSFDMSDGSTYYAWIDYDGENKVLSVRINNSNTRPEEPNFTYDVDLTKILQQEEAYVGFTAATGASAENHDILQWYLVNQYQPINTEKYDYVLSPTDVQLVFDKEASTLTATIKNVDGSPAKNVPVTFTTDKGSFDETVIYTDDSGRAVAKLNSSDCEGTAHMKAEVKEGIYGTIKAKLHLEAPQLKSAVSGDRHVEIMWNPVIDATGYKIYKSTAAGTYSDSDLVDTVTDAVYHYEITNLTNETPYYFVVKAKNDKEDSKNSNEISATPKPLPSGAPILETPKVSDSHVKITWKEVEGATGYKVYKRTKTDDYSTPITTVAGFVYNYMAADLENNTPYYFVVKAVNPKGDSDYSNEVGAVPQALINNVLLEDKVVSAEEKYTTIKGTGNTEDTIWIAPEGTTEFISDDKDKKSTSGDSNIISVPSDDGEYRIYVVDQWGNVSEASEGKVIVDRTAPSVYGVQNQQTYTEPTTITFYEGTAKLDEKDFTSGDKVEDNGKHTLVVTDEYGNSKTISFTIDKNAKIMNAIKIGYQEGDSADSVTKDITLPTTAIDGSTITWESSNTDIMGDDGVIKSLLPYDATIILTATIIKDGVMLSKNFVIKVLKKGSSGTSPSVDGVENNKVYHEARKITFSEGTAKLNGKDFTSGDIVEENGEYTLVVTDKNGNSTTIKFTIEKNSGGKVTIDFKEGDSADSVTKDVTLPTTGADGSTITWKSSNPDIMGSDGVIKSLPQENTYITLTATITKDGVTTTQEFKIRILKKEFSGITIITDQEKVDDTKLQEAIDAAKTQNKDAVIIKVRKEVTNGSPAKVSISKKEVEDAKNKGINLILETDNTSIAVPINTVDTSDMDGSSRLKLVCEQVDTEASENKEMVDAVKKINEDMGIYKHKIFDFSMIKIEEDKDGNETSSETIHFTSDKDIILGILVGVVDTGDALMTFYYNPNTKEWEYVRGKYQEASGEIQIATKHLSTYSVMTLTPEQKREELTKLINDPDITVPEVRYILEDEDMKSALDKFDKYASFAEQYKNETAQGIIDGKKTREDNKYKDYNDLEKEFNTNVDKIYSRLHDHSDGSSHSTSSSSGGAASKTKNTSTIEILKGKEDLTVKEASEKGLSPKDEDMKLISDVYTVNGTKENIDGQIKITYDESKVENEDHLAVFVYNSEKDQWNCLGGVVDKDKNTVTVKMDQEGKIAVIELTKTFKDLDGHWAQEIIETLAARQIITGDGQGHFNPNMGITRAEFATLISKMLHLPLSGTDTGFTDVAPDDWFAPYSTAARKAGIIKGVSETEYEPDRIVNREEMTAIVMRAYKYANGTEITDGEINKEAEFVDSEKIGDWAYKNVYAAKYLNLIQGRDHNTFMPQSETTKAEAAVLVYRFLKVLNEI